MPRLLIVFTLLLTSVVGCVKPPPPKIVSQGPREVLAPKSELIVITNDGPREGARRVVNQVGSILFLNENADGAVLVRVRAVEGVSYDDPVQLGTTGHTSSMVEVAEGFYVGKLVIPRGLRLRDEVISIEFVGQEGFRSVQRAAHKPLSSADSAANRDTP